MLDTVDQETGRFSDELRVHTSEPAGGDAFIDEFADPLRGCPAILQRIGAAEAADVSAELDARPGAPDPASSSR